MTSSSALFAVFEVIDGGERSNWPDGGFLPMTAIEDDDDDAAGFEPATETLLSMEVDTPGCESTDDDNGRLFCLRTGGADGIVGSRLSSATESRSCEATGNSMSANQSDINGQR